MEQTANIGGGAVWPLAQLNAVAAVAREQGWGTHMDGARMMNACVAAAVSPAEMAAGFDSVWLDFTKGLGAPLGGGRVALVHVGRDVVEQERRGEGRGLGRLHLHHAHAAAADRLQQALQRRHLEHVREHLAIRIEKHRERAVLDRHLLQVMRLQPLLPERRPLPGPAPTSR